MLQPRWWHSRARTSSISSEMKERGWGWRWWVGGWRGLNTHSVSSQFIHLMFSQSHTSEGASSPPPPSSPFISRQPPASSLFTSLIYQPGFIKQIKGVCCSFLFIYLFIFTFSSYLKGLNSKCRLHTLERLSGKQTQRGGGSGRACFPHQSVALRSSSEGSRREADKVVVS